MKKKYIKIAEKTIDVNPYWHYKIDEYILPNGKKANYYYAHTPGSTMIIPQFGKEFILTVQFRYLNQKKSIEFPGGGVKQQVSIEENAKLELLQETGFYAKEIKPIGYFNPCNGLTDEICYVFYTNELIKEKQDLDESEEIEVLFLREEEIEQKIQNGEIWDGMTLASWLLYKSLHY
ncbi:MAG: NUDIX hydrolase [Ignavibacteria bacterium]|nr:NUDIX hydrolase [Ignavibacteria bacterium]